MRKKFGFGSLVVASLLILATSWAVMVNPGTTIANPPPHDHGGGEEEPPVLFDVSTESGSAIEIVGIFNSDGTVDEDGIPEGRVGTSNVVVNRPSPALELDF